VHSLDILAHLEPFLWRLLLTGFLARFVTRETMHTEFNNAMREPVESQLVYDSRKPDEVKRKKTPIEEVDRWIAEITRAGTVVWFE
jgi:hypothetical protein